MPCKTYTQTLLNHLYKNIIIFGLQGCRKIGFLGTTPSTKIPSEIGRALHQAQIQVLEPQHHLVVDALVCLPPDNHAPYAINELPAALNLALESSLNPDGKLLLPLTINQHFPQDDLQHIADWAQTNDLSLTHLIPMGAFTGLVTNHWLEAIENDLFWQRLMAWISADPNLLEFCIYIEREIISNLPLGATPFAFAIFTNALGTQKAVAKERNHYLIHQYQSIREKEDLLPLLPLENSNFNQKLSQLLKHPKSRLMTYWLLNHIKKTFELPFLFELLPENCTETFREWEHQDNTDASVMKIIEQWHQHGAGLSEFNYAGVSMAEMMGYELIRPLLTQHFKALTGIRK